MAQEVTAAISLKRNLTAYSVCADERFFAFRCRHSVGVKLARLPGTNDD
jgi:hypothetical protein